MKNFEIRAQAREALSGQWGINALIYFAIAVITSVIGYAVSNILGVNLLTSDSGSFLYMIVTWLLGIFVLFGFTYSQYYVALEVASGERAEIGDAFAIFNSKYYKPMLVFNLISTIIQTILGFIMAIPIMIFFGFGAFLLFAVNGATSASQIISSNMVGGASVALGVIVVLAVAIIYVIISFVITAVFQFAAWAKLEDPELPTLKSVSYGWFLVKDRLWRLFLLGLSFIGWVILAILTIGIGFLWLQPYINTSLAFFYRDAKQEKDFMNA